MPLSTVIKPTLIAYFGTSATDQPCRFGGKELITANGLNEYDFGARQYYTAVPGFTRIDPMAEKYPWLSPYLYCANNPVNFVDPSGMVWKYPEEAKQLQRNIDVRIASYQKESATHEGKNEDSSSKISDLNERIKTLEGCKSDIDILGDDNSHTYVFARTDGDGLHMVRSGDDGLVYIETSQDALSIHEVTHVRQSIESGGLVFNSKGELENSGLKETKHMRKIQKIADNEVEAYKNQFAFNPSAMPKKVSNIGSIDVHYVGSLRTGNGMPAYQIIKDYSDLLKRISNIK